MALALTITVATPVLADDLSIATPHRYEMTPNASGFFVDLAGTVLTARHVVNGCQSLYLLKDGRVARAELVAVSDESDLALLHSSIKPYLAAVFAAGDQCKAIGRCSPPAMMRWCIRKTARLDVQWFFSRSSVPSE